MELCLNREPDQAAEEAAEAQQIQYEREQGVECAYTPFQLTAAENGELLGVLCGYAVYREIYADDLVVFDGYRGRGVGRRLLEEAEGLFPEREIDYIHLVTNGFQAPGFYEKCGYTLEFLRKSPKDPRYDKYYYSKRLYRQRRAKKEGSPIGELLLL